MYANEDKEFPRKKLVETFCKILSKLYIIFQTVMSEMVVLYSQKCHFCTMKNIFRHSWKSKMYIFCDEEDDNSELQSAVTGV